MAALVLVLFDLLRKQWLCCAGRLAVWAGVLVLMTQGRQNFLLATQKLHAYQEMTAAKTTEVIGHVEHPGVVVLYYGGLRCALCPGLRQ